jgi:hypothetical protein
LCSAGTPSWVESCGRHHANRCVQGIFSALGRNPIRAAPCRAAEGTAPWWLRRRRRAPSRPARPPSATLPSELPRGEWSTAGARLRRFRPETRPSLSMPEALSTEERGPSWGHRGQAPSLGHPRPAGAVRVGAGPLGERPGGCPATGAHLLARPVERDRRLAGSHELDGRLRLVHHHGHGAMLATRLPARDAPNPEGQGSPCGHQARGERSTPETRPRSEGSGPGPLTRNMQPISSSSGGTGAVPIRGRSVFASSSPLGNP